MIYNNIQPMQKHTQIICSRILLLLLKLHILLILILEFFVPLELSNNIIRAYMAKKNL